MFFAGSVVGYNALVSAYERGPEPSSGFRALGFRALGLAFRVPEAVNRKPWKQGLGFRA